MQVHYAEYCIYYLKDFMNLSMRYLSLLLCVGFLVNAKEDKKEKKMSENKAVVAKIAIVDVRRIITQDPDAVKFAADEWRDLFNKLQETLRPATQEMAELEAQFKKKIGEIETLQKSGVSSREMLRKKYEEEAAPLQAQLENQYQQFRRFSDEELYKAQAAVVPKVEKAIDAVCDAQGWDFAISKDALPSRRLAKRFDITDDVLHLVNSQYAAEKAKKAEQSKEKAK